MTYIATPLAVHGDHVRLSFRSANCSWCFPLPPVEPVSWHARARAHQLPTSVVGGAPRIDGPVPGASDETPSPRGLARRVRQSAVITVRRSDRGEGAGSEVPARAPSAVGALSAASVASRP